MLEPERFSCCIRIEEVSKVTINERIFAALNAKPDATIEELTQGDKRSTVTAVRNFWRKTRHKAYTSSSTVPDPVETARAILIKATKQGVAEAEGRDLAIDAGVAHGTAFSVAAQVYRDARRQQPNLKSARGTWTVLTESGVEIPVCHNIRVDWTQEPPVYNDAFKKISKKYHRWLSAFANGYAVVQKGKIEDGVETRAPDSYWGCPQTVLVRYADKDDLRKLATRGPIVKVAG